MSSCTSEFSLEHLFPKLQAFIGGSLGMGFILNALLLSIAVWAAPPESHRPYSDALALALNEAKQIQNNWKVAKAQTPPITGAKLDEAYEEALSATNSNVRFAALDALGHSKEPRAQDLLMQLYKKMDSAQDRAIILSYIVPRLPLNVLVLQTAGRSQSSLWPPINQRSNQSRAR